MRRTKSFTSIFLTILLLLQCLSITALAASGFTDVKISADVPSQTVTVTGNASGAQKELTVILKQNSKIVYLNQYSSDNNGDFSISMPVSFTYGDPFTLQLGGASLTEAYSTNFTVSGNNSGGDSGGDSGGSAAPTPVTTFTITATAGTGGTITPTSAQVKKNESATFSIKANSGYEIKNVLVDGASVGAVSTYTFNNVTSDHSISAEFSKKKTSYSFSDVKSGSWYYDAVMFACEHGLFAGTSTTTFSPDAEMTRSMLVTVLYRLAGKPESGNSNFGDVEAGSWYADAVAWASSEGIVMGNADGKFDPDGNITREQIATILYRFVLKTGRDSSASGDLSKFSDSGEVSDFAAAAMKWAVGCGLISGKDGGVLDPGGDATRAEVATIMMRFFKQFAM